MTAILGLSAFYHDSAASLLVDGRIRSATQEERFTRRKYDDRFPQQAVAYALAEAGLRPADLDYVAYYEQPFTRFERLLETYVTHAPGGFASFRQALPAWLRRKLHVAREIRRGLRAADGGAGGDDFRGRILYPGHHESHAASAFYPSPFEEAAIVTLDGVGEWATTTVGRGTGNRIELLDAIRYPHSIGLLYSAFTYYCGFAVNGGEYKLMGLAPYGQPRYTDAILTDLIDLRPDGSFWLNPEYFTYGHSLRMVGTRFERRFGGPPRQPDSRIESRHMDLAASIQRVCEEALLRIARHAHERAGRPDNLVMAGGVALNCVANGRLLREGPFKNLWIQPAAGDAGGALGAALFVHHQVLGLPRTPDRPDSQQASFLGPEFSGPEIEAFLRSTGAVASEFEDEAQLLGRVAQELARGQIVGWFQGRAEFWPRALGARSILGDPRRPELQSALNLKIKFRESFRPFAPVVLREHAHEWFEVSEDLDSPYMLIVAPVAQRRRLALTAEQQETLTGDPDLSRRVAVPRSTIPAVTHVDYSARLQTVDARHGRFRRLLEAFFAQTGCPVLANTSFNLSWEPIVLTPAEAYHTFMQSDMDVLVLGDHLLHKAEQPLGLYGHDSSPRMVLRPQPPLAPRSGETPTRNVRELLESGRRIDLLRRLNDELPHSARIVEFGCGNGTTTCFLAVAHRYVLGIDTEENAIVQAERLRDAYGLTRALFAQTSLVDPGLRKESFDIILALDPRALAGRESEVASVMSGCLASAGWLVLALGGGPIRAHPPPVVSSPRVFPARPRPFGALAWSQVLRANGLEVLALEPSPRPWAEPREGPLFDPRCTHPPGWLDLSLADVAATRRHTILLARKAAVR